MCRYQSTKQLIKIININRYVYTNVGPGWNQIHNLRYHWANRPDGLWILSPWSSDVTSYKLYLSYLIVRNTNIPVYPYITTIKKASKFLAGGIRGDHADSPWPRHRYDHLWVLHQPVDGTYSINHCMARSNECSANQNIEYLYPLCGIIAIGERFISVSNDKRLKNLLVNQRDEMKFSLFRVECRIDYAGF